MCSLSAWENETITDETGEKHGAKMGEEGGRKGETWNGTKSARGGAVKSLALITEGSKENDGSRYSIMFLRFAREEGETVYLCYWHFSFDRLYSHVSLYLARAFDTHKNYRGAVELVLGWFIAFRWLADDNDWFIIQAAAGKCERFSHALYALSHVTHERCDFS